MKFRNKLELHLWPTKNSRKYQRANAATPEEFWVIFWPKFAPKIIYVFENQPPLQFIVGMLGIFRPLSDIICPTVKSNRKVFPCSNAFLKKLKFHR